MHTPISRLQAILSISFNMTVVFLFLTAFLYHITFSHLPVKKSIVNLSYRRTFPHFEFTPHVDLSSQFKNPGLKQIFLYLAIKHQDKEEIIWSNVVTRSSNKSFYKTVSSNYKMRFTPKEGKAKLELRANYVPYVGILTDAVIAEQSVILKVNN